MDSSKREETINRIRSDKISTDSRYRSKTVMIRKKNLNGIFEELQEKEEEWINLRDICSPRFTVDPKAFLEEIYTEGTGYHCIVRMSVDIKADLSEIERKEMLIIEFFWCAGNLFMRIFEEYEWFSQFPSVTKTKGCKY